MTTKAGTAVFVTSCLLLTSLQLSAEEEPSDISHSHWRRTPLSDLGVRFQGHKAELSGRSVTSCAASCHGNPPCLSFSVHVTSRRCFLFASRLLFGRDMERQPGYRHYWRVYSQCPTSAGYDYVTSVNVCYRAFATLDDRKSWLNASSACEEDNGHLYIASTLERMAVITTYLTDHGYENLQFKLGGNDLWEEGWFRWLDGSGVVTWYSGQPDNRDGLQHCMENTRGHPGYTSDGKCDTGDRYVCQIPLH